MTTDRIHAFAPTEEEWREGLGRVVRNAWIRWAEKQPNPKPSWLVPYFMLNEADKEADRQIGEAVAQYVRACDKEWNDPNWRERIAADLAEEAQHGDL